MRDFFSLKRSYLKFLNRCSEYITNNPTAKLTHDEMNESNPILGFTHKKGNVTIVTTFTLNRKNDE